MKSWYWWLTSCLASWRCEPLSDNTYYPPKPGATPKRTPTYRAQHAHYHPVKISAKWAAIVDAMKADRKRSAEQDAAHDRERHNETTYARGTTGGS